MQFPHNQFISAISDIINQRFEQQSMLPQLIDAPCGNGYTTIALAQKYPNTHFVGVDIANHFLKTNLSNTSFLSQDIHQYIDSQDNIAFICVINSLYLLPNPTELLRKIYHKLEHNGTLVLIVPNIESPNFKTFQSNNPDVNTFLPTQSELESCFLDIGFQVKSTKSLVFTPFYGRWDTKILYFMRHKYLNWLEQRNAQKQGRVCAYYLYELVK